MDSSSRPKSHVQVQRLLLWGCIVALISLLLGMTVMYGMMTLKNHSQVTARTTPAHDGNLTTTVEQDTIASVAEKVSKSVVSITTQSVDMSYYGSTEQQGAGTGIVVSKDGYVLTNKHVIEGASTINAILSDGTAYKNIRLLGTDPLNDIAFLKIEGARDLTPAELGDSTTVKVGQRVIAIGNSLGQYQNTVTSGIISGTGRPIAAQNGSSVETLTDLLQTDAAINPGNSGGPLLNMSGQVVGINTAIVEDAQGIGFAIPINATKGTLKGVLLGKKVERAYAGVSYVPLTPILAKEFGLDVAKGAYVYRENGQSAVAADSPAAKAGLRDKDIITHINNIEVGLRGGVSTLIGEYAPGDTVEMTLKRGQQTMVVKITLTSYQTRS